MTQTDLEKLQQQPGMSPEPVGEGKGQAREQELQQNAQTAYEQVPTQEEMLAGGKGAPGLPQQADKADAKKDAVQPAQANEQPKKDGNLNELLDDAAQQGNMGGG